MAWPRLDTRPWHLGALALGVGGCGPLVPLPADTDGDTKPSDDDAPPDSSAESFPTASDSVGPGCGGGPPCQPGYVCVDGYCQYDDYCATCCEGECGGSYDCFSHEECGGGSYCDYYTCRPLPYLYDCDPGGALAFELIPDVGGVPSLAFADTNGDGYDDLAAVWGMSGALVRGPDASEFIGFTIFGGRQGHVVATEVDGVPPTELTFAFVESDTLFTFRVDGFPEDEIGASEPALAWPVAGDFDLDGRDDVAGNNGALSAVFWEGGGFSGFTDFAGGIASALAVGTFGPMPGEDIVYSDGFIWFAEVWPGSVATSVLEELYPTEIRTPAVGDFDGNGLDDIAAIAPDAGGYYGVLVTWAQIASTEFSRNPYALGPELAPSDDGFFPTAVGDLDGDGTDDLVVGGFGTLTVFWGSLGGNANFACWSQIPIDATARHVAAGDHDGNGRADVAWSDGVATTRIRLSK